MSTCLYITPEELKKYSALGINLHEITRDYLEKGRLRSPMAIKNKLDIRNSKNDTYFEQQKQEDLVKEALKHDTKTAENWMTQLSTVLGLPVNIISEQEASAIHATKGKIYSGEKAFFVDGTVYFIEGTLTPESVFHEFSHPIIKSLSSELRTSLYNSIINEPFGEALLEEVKALYTGEVTQEQIEEEVLVRSLVKSIEELGASPRIKSIFDNLLFHIRQALRKLLGRSVNVGNLKADTTLKQLAEMIAKGDVQELQKDLITSTDIIEYFKDQENFVNAFDVIVNEDAEGVQNMIDNMFDVTMEIKKDVQENEGFYNFSELLLNEYHTGILDEMSAILGVSSTLSRKEVVHHIMATEQGKINAEKVKERLKNLSQTLFKLEELFDTMNKELSEMKSLNSKEIIDRLIYYKKFVESWEGTITNFTNYSDFQRDSPLKTLAESLRYSSNEATKQIKRLQVNALEDLIFESMEGPAKKALEDFNKAVAYKENARAADKVIDRMYYEFHNMSKAEYNQFKKLKAAGAQTEEYKRLYDRWLVGLDFNRDKVKALLNGETPDASWMNSQLESLSMNTDPAISSVYLHIQNLKSRYQVESLNFYNRFVAELIPHIEKNGVKFQNRGSVGRDMGFKDTVGVLNESTGEIEKIEQWTFLNQWSGNSYDEKVLKNEIKKTRDAYKYTNTDTDKKAWLKAERSYQLWKNEYMNQRYSVEYYEAQDLLMKDDIGIEAKERIQEVQEELNLLMQKNEGGQHDLNIDNLKVKLSNLYLTHDNLGVKKTGLELEVAERLTEYRKARSKFFIEDEIPGAFQKAYDEYEVAMIDKGFSEDSLKAEMDKWLEKNTRVSLKNSVHEKRTALINEKKELLLLLSEENKKIFDTTEQQKNISDQVNIVKDSENQPNGQEATESARNEVLKAHKEIEEAKLKHMTKLGLSGEDAKRYNELRKIYTEAGKVWNDSALEKEFSDLMKKKEIQSAKLGLSAQNVARIQEIDKILSEMSDTIPTDYYKEMVTKILVDENLVDLLMEFSEEAGYSYEHVGDAINSDILEFINSTQGEKAMEKSSSLKSWVEQNHYDRNNELVQTNLWKLTQSKDPFDYKTKRLYDSNKKSLGLIEINGTYRIPNNQFYTKVVKDEYVTKEVVGETVDNKGNFLPKNEPSNRYVNQAYEKLKKEDPDMFEFMETLKNIYLEAQKDSDPYDRAYLAYPKVQKTGLENIITRNIWSWWRRLRESIVGSDVDVYEYKTADSSFKADQEMLRATTPVATDVTVPVVGMYGPPNIKDVSTDILKTIPEYIASLNHKKAARSANSYAQMMKSHFEETKVDEREWNTNARSLLRKSSTMSVADKFSKSKKNIRSGTINEIIERDLNGIHLKGVGKDFRQMNKLMSSITKRSSKINFNWNLMSGVVNYGQIKITSLTHAASFDEVNLLDGYHGEKWALKTMGSISKNVRSRGQKSLNEQILNTFDPISGRTDEIIGDSMTRTLIGDVLQGKLAQSSRKWMELEGTIQNFGALMHHKKISITDENGNVKEIPYLDSFELVDGLVQSKKGVDPYYAIGYDSEGNFKAGEGFYEQRNYMQNVIMKWNGAFAKKDASLLSRYVLAKQLLFLKKHVIPLASKQYSFALGTWKKGELPQLKKRMNWTTGTAEFGHTVTTLRFVRDLLSFQIGRFPTMTKQEMKSIFFTMHQIVIGYIVLPYLYRLLTPLGVGDDDEEEKEGPDFAAMKDRSGYFEGMFTVDQDYYSFEKEGYLLNMLSMVSLKLKDEYNSVNWLGHPSGMADALSQGTSQSIGFVQTFKFYKDAIAMISGDKRSIPGKTTGPYFFQEEGYSYEMGIPGIETGYNGIDVGGNMIELLFKWNGVNSKMIDPTGTQQAYISAKQTR